MTASAPIDAAMRIGVARSRVASTSANVYRPRLRSGSAIRNITTGQPTRNPIEYSSPSKPEVETRPTMQEAGRAHVVAGQRKTILKAGDAAAGGVELICRPRFPR